MNKVPLKNRIISIMQNHENTRDDWQYLLAMIWRQEVDHTVSSYVFLGMVAKRKVSSPENVRRTWQKILEEVPELRGPEYRHRHKILEPEHIQQVKELGQSLKPQQGMF